MSALLCLAACNTVEKDVEIPEKDDTGKVEVIITASTDTDTKTVLDDNYTTVLWKPSDEIKVFSAGEDSKFTSLNTTTSSIAQFRGMISVITGISEGVGYDNNIYGLYPYNDDATISNGVITTTLPNTQTAVADSFDDDLFITIGKSETLSMGFYNVCSGLRFSFSEGGYTSVTLSSNNGEALAGTFSVGFDNSGKPVIQSVSSPSTSITVNAPTGGFVANTWYYIICLPGTFDGGITLSATTENDSGTYTINSSLTFSRGLFKQVSGLDGRLIKQPNNEIWYTSVSGAVSYPTRTDNWGKTIISNTYENGKGVITFSGPIELIPENAFYMNSSSGGTLKSLSMPNSVTEIGYQAFYQQQKLEEITLSKNLTTISGRAFYSCSRLKNFTFSESLLSVGVNVFSYSGLTDLTILTDRTLDDRGLGYLLTSAYGIACFHGPYASSDGKFVVMNNELAAATQMDANMIIPDGIQRIQPYVFYRHSQLEYVYIPASVSSIGSKSFNICTHLEQISVQSVTPPSIGEYTFDDTNDCPIIVPSQSVDTYKSAWPKYQNRISSGEIILSDSSLILSASETKSLTAHCYLLSPTADKTITWSSDNTSVATVDGGTIRGISGGRAIITASACNGSITGTCEVIVYEPIDLGLSVKWANMNLGASSPTERGNRYAWGETEPKLDYSWSTYKFGANSSGPFSKYNTKSSYGTVDNKTVLDPEDDAAYLILGGSWRMPTKDELDELRSTCSFQWSYPNGILGITVVAPNGNSIFFSSSGDDCSYWSSTLYANYPNQAYCFEAEDSEGWDTSMYASPISRVAGKPIRPVYVE